MGVLGAMDECPAWNEPTGLPEGVTQEEYDRVRAEAVAWAIAHPHAPLAERLRWLETLSEAQVQALAWAGWQASRADGEPADG